MSTSDTGPAPAPAPAPAPISVPLSVPTPVPFPMPVQQIRWPRTIEISTRITIPVAFTPETLASQQPEGADPATSCLADTNVSIRFADEKPESDVAAAASSKTASPAPSIAEETVPCPDQTFLIRDPDCGKCIAMNDGALELYGTLPSNPAAHWTCFEANGWLGFRNRATGMVMGHNGRGVFHAKVTHHKPHEWFQTRRHPEGGYLLLVKHRDYLWRMDVGTDGKGLIERPEGGKRWQFVRVD